jgi:ubiquinone/menaquinone biosynthesis C-methylase UbiE
MSSELTDSKAAERAFWSAGNYDAIAELFWEVGAVVAGAVSIAPGMRVLDVATGTGSAAIRAAQAGAEVVGLDIAETMFERARHRAAEAGVEVEWVQGDAEALPYEDDGFDRVLTAFGTMFAARHDVAAGELVRVCRPGGEVVMANWCPDGFVGRAWAMLRRYRPLEAPEAATFLEWGTHGHVRRRLGGQLVLAIEPHSVDLVFASVDDMVDRFAASFPPIVDAKAALEAAEFDALLAELRALIVELDVGDGETRVPATYVLVTGHKPVADLRPNC